MPSMRRPWLRKLGLLPAAALLASCASATMGGLGQELRDPPAEITLPAQGAQADFGKIHSDVDKYTNRGPTRSHTRESCSGCPSVNVDIQSIGNTTTVNPNAVLPRPRIIGRIKNNGETEEANYGLKAGTEYLIYLEPSPGGAVGANLSLFELPSGGTGTATKINLGPIQVCHSYQSGNRPSDTDFRDYSECVPPVPARGGPRPVGGGQGPGPNLISRLFGRERSGATLTLTSGVWFECDPGCCVGSAFYLSTL